MDDYEIILVSILVLYDDRGRVLLQHRTADAPMNPNRWGFFGGGIEAGETPLQALNREAYEELRYRPVNPRLFAQLDFVCHELKARGTRHYFLDAYQQGLKLELLEGQDMGWFFREEVLHLDILPEHREQLDGIFAELQDNLNEK